MDDIPKGVDRDGMCGKKFHKRKRTVKEKKKYGQQGSQATVKELLGEKIDASEESEEAKSTGRDRIIFGIIGLAVIIGVWGLVAILRNTFDLRNQGNLQLPTVPVVIPGQGGNNNPFGN